MSGASKYQHVFGHAPKKEYAIENVKVTNSSWDTNLLSASGKYISINWNASGGGAFAILPLPSPFTSIPDFPSKLPDSIPLARSHNAPVLDTDWSLHDDSLVASAGEDGKVMLWKVEEAAFSGWGSDGWVPTDFDPILRIDASPKMIGQVIFHPTASNVLASASGEHTVKLWDLANPENAKVTLGGHADTIQSFAFNFTGTLLVTICRDRKLRLFDPRSGGDAIRAVDGHGGINGARVVWMGDFDRFATTGFSKMSDRQTTASSEQKGRGQFVDVGVYPMGIDVRALAEKRREPEVAEWVHVLKQRYAGMKIVVGRDKLDEIQGVQHKIKAFERFLEKYPEFQEKVVLIQVALQTTDSPTTTTVADSVSHINSRFSTLTYQPVVFLHTHDLTSFSQYLALLSVADAFLVTSLREGMALRAHEFVECQEGRHRPLILSEFTGSYSYSGFRSCIAINPWDTRGTADAIHQALTMGDEEALSRWEDLHNHVTTQTSQTFVTSFLTRCVRAHTEHLHAHDDSESTDRASLDIPRLIPQYKHSSRRLIVVDLEATLWDRDIERVRNQQIEDNGLEKDVELDAVKRVVELLDKLASDKKNDVWVLSGLPVGGVIGDIAKKVPFFSYGISVVRPVHETPTVAAIPNRKPSNRARIKDIAQERPRPARAVTRSRHAPWAACPKLGYFHTNSLAVVDSD